MPLFKALSYKTKLIALYVSTTVLGIILTLFSIYNASYEQLKLDHLNNVYGIFSDNPILVSQLSDFRSQPTELAGKQFKVLLLAEMKSRMIKSGDCKFLLSNDALASGRMTEQGGYIGTVPCMYSWFEVNDEVLNKPVLVFYQFNAGNIDSIISAYSNRLIIPLVFFIWLVVWGSLILGNLITRLQVQKDEVEHLAMHDSLTGLANRKKFSEEITEVIAYSSRKKLSFMLAMVDLNKFKNVNDDLGHQYGDMLLQQVAKRFKDSVREYDVVARFGGDEFVLLLMNADLDSNLKVLQRIYENIVKEYELLEHTVCIGASIGVSCFPDDDITYAELVHKADIAMYYAKDTGGGVQVYKSHMLA